MYVTGLVKEGLYFDPVMMRITINLTQGVLGYWHWTYPSEGHKPACLPSYADMQLSLHYTCASAYTPVTMEDGSPHDPWDPEGS